MYRYTVRLLDWQGNLKDWHGTNDGAEAMRLEDMLLGKATEQGDTVVLREGEHTLRSIRF